MSLSGNIDALRDWGHAKDYVKMQWLMLQQNKPNDYVIATGNQFSVRQFIEWSAEELGVKIKFKGEGINEVGYVDTVYGEKAPNLKPGDEIIKIDPKYFRPTEVENLIGDPSKAKKELNWVPEISAKDLCKEMVQNDLNEAKKMALLIDNGYKNNKSQE